MVLLQVAPTMPCDLGRLGAALQALGDPSRVAVEFRASCWQAVEVWRLLEELGAVYVYADSPRNPLPDLSHSQQWPIGQRAYLRLHGRSHWYASDYSAEELRGIADLALDLAGRGAKEVYIFFNNDLGGYAPRNALALAATLES
jgi:uncharacterized protein YecE (DUF72 family)